MQIINRAKIMFIIVTIIMVLMSLWICWILPFVGNRSNLKKDIAKLQYRAAELEMQEAEILRVEKEMNVMKREVESMDGLFLSSLCQEEIIHTLNELERVSEIDFHSMEFSPAQQLNIPMLQQDNSSLNESTDIQTLEEIAKTVEVNIDFIGTWEQSKELLQCIYQYPYIIVLDFSFHQGNSIDQIQGSIKLEFIAIFRR